MSSVRQRGDFGTDDEAESTLYSVSGVPVSLRQYRRSDVYLLIAVLTGLAVVVVCVFALVVVMEVGLETEDDMTRPLTKTGLPSEPQERARALLNDYPIVDG